MTGPRRSHEPKNPLSCHDRALGLLAVRPRSLRELQTRLLRAGFQREEVEDELQRLAAVGLVDDEKFALEYAQHAVDKRLVGRRVIASALAAKGVDRRTIEQALEEVGGDEAERASRLAHERARSLGGHPPEVAFRRLVSFLERRGYQWDVAARAARAALELEAAEP